MRLFRTSSLHLGSRITISGESLGYLKQCSTHLHPLLQVRYPVLDTANPYLPFVTKRKDYQMDKSKLQEYTRKRNFDATPEPVASQNKKSAKPIWVVQKHDASSLHYDFRLEIDGTLKSWAVPKGPSTDPAEKRLAVPTEDHPVEYARFEGTIPEDEYGGGTVMIWDAGTYRNLKEEEGNNDDKGSVSMHESYKQGHITVYLEEGRKISGGYALIRTGSDADAQWLLIKMDDEKSDARRNPVSTEPDSIATGRSLDEIAKEKGSD